MSEIEQRYLVLRRWNGETHVAIEYGDRKVTLRDITAKPPRAARIAITPIQAMMGPRKLLERARLSL